MSTTKDLNIFQIVIVVIFLIMGIIGIAFFATGKSGVGGTSYKSTIWGVLPKANIDAGLEPFRIKGQEDSIYLKLPFLLYIELSGIQILYRNLLTNIRNFCFFTTFRIRFICQNGKSINLC